MTCLLTGLLAVGCNQECEYTTFDEILSADNCILVLDTIALKSTATIPRNGTLCYCSHIHRYFFREEISLRFRGVMPTPVKNPTIALRVDSMYKPKCSFAVTDPHYVTFGKSPQKIALFAINAGQITFTQGGYGYIKQALRFAFDYNAQTHVLTISAYDWESLHFLREQLAVVHTRRALTHNLFMAQVNELKTDHL